MPAVYGKDTTCNDASLGRLRFNIEDFVEQCPAKKFPLIRRLNNGSILRNAVNTTKCEGKEESLRPTEDTLGATSASSAATTVADNARIVRIGIA